MINSTQEASASALLLAAGLLVSACEKPPIDTVQGGFRGTGMVHVSNPRIVETQASVNAVPAALPAVPREGQKASEVYQNVKVLGDVSVAEFTRIMVAMTQWVAPQQGCGYCHNLQNLADDSMYTKVVARRMIQMTQNINSDYKTHVADTGVTCYTCHRGMPVPANVWFAPEPQKHATRMVGSNGGQNTAAESVALASLPYDPFTPYLSKAQTIAVNATTALPNERVGSIAATEQTYALMMHMSDGLGVNCTYCHNSRAFSSWSTSTPQRVTAWHGIRMARDLNNTYMEPLTQTFPVNRLGALGDVAKVNCATCHQGAYKPMYGASMLKDYPALSAAGAHAAIPVPAEAEASAPPPVRAGSRSCTTEAPKS
jgi:photosynthetic reaction center cytochrome c subunit